MGKPTKADLKLAQMMLDVRKALHHPSRMGTAMCKELDIQIILMERNNTGIFDISTSSIINKIDPTPVEAIDFIKSKLRELE